MWYVLRREDECARPRLEHEITDMECELAFEDVPRLVLSAVDVQRRFSEFRHHGFAERELVTRGATSSLDIEQSAEGPECPGLPGVGGERFCLLMFNHGSFSRIWRLRSSA